MIRLLIVDNSLLVCEAMQIALQKQTDIGVAALATCATQALEQLAVENYDIILISSNLPEGSALNLTESIALNHPEIRILILGITNIEAIILRYIETGAIGYLLPEESFDQLLRKIRAAVHEQAVVTPQIAATLIARVAKLADRLVNLGVDPTDCERLTMREKEILDLIADGLTNQAIADRLLIEVGTVKNHVHSILEKLNVNTRQDAAIYHSLFEREHEPLINQ